MEFEEPAPKYFPKMSPAEFLQWERQQKLRHEYLNGEVFAMSGASINHNRISSNIHGRIWNYLQDKPCEIFSSDLRVAIKAKNSYFYPDVVIACDELEFDDDLIKDTVKNPTVVFEILSASTEDFDMGRKMMFYMQIESLQQYIMIDSKKVHVRVITKRGEERTWKFDEFLNLTDHFTIDPIHYNFSLENLYKGVKF